MSVLNGLTYPVFYNEPAKEIKKSCPEHGLWQSQRRYCPECYIEACRGTPTFSDAARAVGYGSSGESEYSRLLRKRMSPWG